MALPLKTAKPSSLATDRSLTQGSVLKNLHLAPVCCQYRFKVAALTFKAIEGLGPV